LAESVALTQQIRDLLDGAGVQYRFVEHPPTRTSEESAAARGEELRLGGKALLIKAGDDFALFVLSAVLKLDSDAVKQRFAVRKIRFASADELMSMTGLTPGSVPPFGRPLLPFPLYIDESIAANERIAFNAGSLTQSIVMPVADYLRLSGGEVFRFGATG